MLLRRLKNATGHRLRNIRKTKIENFHSEAFAGKGTVKQLKEYRRAADKYSDFHSEAFPVCETVRREARSWPA